MKLQIVFKQSNQEVARVHGIIHITNKELMKVIQCEKLIEELTGLRCHIEHLPNDEVSEKINDQKR